MKYNFFVNVLAITSIYHLGGCFCLNPLTGHMKSSKLRQSLPNVQSVRIRRNACSLKMMSGSNIAEINQPNEAPKDPGTKTFLGTADNDPSKQPRNRNVIQRFVLLTVVFAKLLVLRFQLGVQQLIGIFRGDKVSRVGTGNSKKPLKLGDRIRLTLSQPRTWLALSVFSFSFAVLSKFITTSSAKTISIPYSIFLKVFIFIWIFYEILKTPHFLLLYCFCCLSLAQWLSSVAPWNGSHKVSLRLKNYHHEFWRFRVRILSN